MALFKHFRHYREYGLRVPRRGINVFNHIEYAWLAVTVALAAITAPLVAPTALSLATLGPNNSAAIQADGSNAYLRPAARTTAAFCSWERSSFLDSS